MTQAKQGDTVKVHYTGKLEDGTVFDSSQDRNPLEFSIGDGGLIPGFETAVIGMNPGDSKTAQIPSTQAYGPHHPDMVIAVEKEKMPDDISVELGQQLFIRQENGQPIPVTVTEVSNGSVTLDANHPLAGKDLTFDIQLLEIV
ncbi:MAG TPA: FKBP-type peptidyl-prolyl cis-trans isomerase [Elainellaceae cyanobacterium]